MHNLESETPKTRDINRDLKAEDDVLQAMDASMTYMTYDARRVLEAMKESLNARLYDQAMVIIWCHKFGINRTHETLLAYKQPSLRETILNVENTNAFERQQKRTNAAAKVKRIENEGEQKISSKQARVDLRDVIYDPKLILYMYSIDQEVLLADYDVRLDRLFALLQDISEQDLMRVLGEIQEAQGRCHMWTVFHKLEEYAGAILRNIKDPEGYHHFVPTEHGVMPLDMQERLQKFIDDRKKARRQDGSH